MRKEWLIVPCYNEERRLKNEDFLALLERRTLSLLLVDDGSTDQTKAHLNDLARKGEGRIEILSLEKNEGKAEAVRRGLLVACHNGAQLVSFTDADFSTPVIELFRLLDAASQGDKLVVMGARVQLLGSSIDRNIARHYSGRVFATVASLALELRVYDTQCGAKVFVTNDRLMGSLAIPFLSKWAFDVELISRLVLQGYSENDFVEMPLRKWTEIKGSKLSLFAAIRAGADLLRIGYRLRRERNKLVSPGKTGGSVS